MARAERMITPTEIRTIVEHGELIEDYPEDARGHSCLRRIFLRGTSGSKTTARGELHELYSLSRGNAPLHSSVQHRPKRLSRGFDSVPAWICGQCGEPYFEEREVDVIQEAIRVLDERTRTLVPEGDSLETQVH